MHLIENVFCSRETQWIVVLCLVADFILFLILESQFDLAYTRSVSTSHEKYCIKFVREYTFTANLWLVVLVLVALLHYKLAYSWAIYPPKEMVLLLIGIVFGKGIKFFLKSGKWKVKMNTELRTFLAILIVLLVFSSCGFNFYNGRWMGLWNNPNIYGMLMGAGVVLAIGLLAANSKLKIQNSKWGRLLFIALGMMAAGLFFSYSRGAWVGTAVGLLYLAKAFGKFKWRLVLPGIFVVAAVVIFFWHGTADTDAWYLKRLDLSRPSAQHRVSAWRGSLQMMLDHPLGVGWNKAVGVYQNNYSPPENGAAALTMNSYLMLGSELGLPGLVCFISYVALRLKSPKSQSAREDARPTTLEIGHGTLDSSKTVCRAGALMLLVAFWFDGGLFTLATASVFWILLELSQVQNAECEIIKCGMRNVETVQKSESGKSE